MSTLRITIDCFYGMFAFFFVFFISCKSEKEHSCEDSSVIIVLDGVKSNYDTLFFKNGASVITPDPVFAINKSISETIHLASITDSLKIENVSEYIIVQHKYSPFSYIEFILQAGDTARISYREGIPFIDILNREPKKYDVNYNYYKVKRYPNEKGMQASEIIRNPSILWYMRRVEDNNTKKTIPDIAGEYFPVLLEELKDEDTWLDSIFNADLMSPFEYQFYKERNNYVSLNLTIQERTEDGLGHILRQYDDSLYVNDRFGGYRSYIHGVGRNYLQRIMNPKEADRETKIYDYLEHQNIISGRYLQDIKLEYLKSIMRTSPIGIRQDYFSRFIDSEPDTVLINTLKNLYGDLLDEGSFDLSDTGLMAYDGTKTSLSSILEEYNGYVIYVDFWASWCAPCRKMFPESKKLQKEFIDEKVLFLYLSLDEDREGWYKVCREEQLTDNSFLILNVRESSFLKEMDIKTIPRYLIYNTKGNIFQKDAPSANNEETRKIIRNLLNE